MSRSDKQQDSRRAPPVPTRKSGRAAFDQDGRSIWEWQTATGVFQRDVTLEQIAQLEDSALAIVEDDYPGRTYAPCTPPAIKPTKQAADSSSKRSLLRRWFDR